MKRQIVWKGVRVYYRRRLRSGKYVIYLTDEPPRLRTGQIRRRVGKLVFATEQAAKVFARGKTYTVEQTFQPHVRTRRKS